jgi:hypothetical protein
VINLENFKVETNSTWGFCQLDYVSNRYMFYSEAAGKTYYEDLEKLDGWLADRKRLRESEYGYDDPYYISNLYCYKTTGYVNTSYEVYEVSDDNGKNQIGEQDEIGWLKRNDFSNLSELVLTSREYPYTYNSYINKKTGKVFYYDQKLTSSRYFVYNPDSKGADPNSTDNRYVEIEGYRFEVYDMINPEKSFSLFQNLDGEWLVLRDGKFDASPSLFQHEYLAAEIFQSYSPGLLTDNITTSDLYAKENYRKVRAFKQFMVDSVYNHHLLMKWIAPGLKEDNYELPIAEFLNKNLLKGEFNGSSWYGGKERKFRMINGKIHFALINSLIDRGFEGYYGIQEGPLLRGLIRDSLLLEGMIFHTGYHEEGKFKNNKLNGKGIRYYNQGTVMNGIFVDGMIAEGEVTFPEGGSYKGGFKKGNYHGKAEFIFSDGKKYVGSFQDGNFQGEGKMFYDNEALYYEGMWAGDKRHGKGKEYNRDGSPDYEGEYKEDKRHGKGIAWVDGKPENAEYFEGDRIDQAYVLRKEREEFKREMEEAERKKMSQRFTIKLSNRTSRAVVFQLYYPDGRILPYHVGDYEDDYISNVPFGTRVSVHASSLGTVNESSTNFSYR